MNYFQSFINLFFPRICCACGSTLMTNDEMVCLKCLHKLPRTGFHEDLQNKAAQLFYGREQVENVISFLYFRKKGIVQNMLHQLKYKGKQDIGEYLGRLYGYDLKVFVRMYPIDLIIPVPLHFKKLKKRGFNQAESFGKGLSGVLNIPIENNLVERLIHNPTQTKKSKYQRWENVNGIFNLKEPHEVENKHVLVVDDVLTTGSTMEAMVVALKKCSSVRVSIATIAFADV